jgi:hydrogenase maturation protease
MLLVIGFGNELRRDDGIGPRIARAVADWDVPGVRVLAVHQLTPELADDIAQAEGVLFIDAAAGGSTVKVSIQPVRPRTALSNSLVNHASSPPALLTLAEVVYGRQPLTWLLTVPARDLGFGEGLSPEAERNLVQALQYVQLWIVKNQQAALL